MNADPTPMNADKAMRVRPGRLSRCIDEHKFMSISAAIGVGSAFIGAQKIFGRITLHRQN